MPPLLCCVSYQQSALLKFLCAHRVCLCVRVGGQHKPHGRWWTIDSKCKQTPKVDRKWMLGAAANCSQSQCCPQANNSFKLWFRVFCFCFFYCVLFCFVLHYFVFWLFIYLIACNSISQLRSCAEHAKLWAKWNLRERERRAVEWEQVPFCFDYCLMLSSSLNRVPTALAVKWSVLGNAFSVLHIYSVYIIFNYSYLIFN